MPEHAFDRTDAATRPVPLHARFAERTAPNAVPSRLDLLAFAAWAGLAAGLVEVLVLAVRNAVEASSTLGGLQMNRNFPWMLPTAQLVLFVAASLPFAAAARRFPDGARRGLATAMVALAVFSLSLLVEGLHDLAAAVFALGLGWRVALFLDRPDRRRVLRRAVRIGLPAMVGIVLLLGGASYRRLVLAERSAVRSLPPARSGAPNVLLIVLDTLRGDRLSLAGYRRATTPNLDRLAARGAAFLEARSPAPWTFPSHATMFTGRWPHELKIVGSRPLDATFPTLAEELSKRGRAAAGFVGNTYYCNAWYGLDRGFAHYEDYYEDGLLVSPKQALRCAGLGRLLIQLAGDHANARPGAANALKDAPKVNRDFLGWLDGQGRAEGAARPFFAFLNYIDVHDPYIPRPDHPVRFGRRPESAADHELLQTWHLRDKKKVSKRDLQLLEDVYDDCLRFLDDQLGRLFDELERRGTLKNTLIVVTSDHGEAFGEHGLYLHGQSLYRPEVHVPLILAGPGVEPAGARVSDPVSLRDVPATVLDLIGEAEGSPFPGRSLSRFWRPPSGEVAGEEPVRIEAAIVAKPIRGSTRPPALRGPTTAIVAEGFVHIRDPLGPEELFDLKADPGETRNLASDPAFAKKLQRMRTLHDADRPATAR